MTDGPDYDETCQYCGHWEKTVPAEDIGQRLGGLCKRHAPHPFVKPLSQITPNEESWSLWPSTDYTDGCGEWKALAATLRHPKDPRGA
jgi:hypothetical protein